MTDAMVKLVVTAPVDTPPGRVYLDYYQLSEAPFAITPDPDFLFSADGHQQVLDKIGYAIDGRMGFILLTGEVGTGKTTVCRTLLDRLSEKAETVYVINPSISGQELLASILEDLGERLPLPATKKALIDQLNQRLLADGTNRPFVVIIDDAQTMMPETLEDLRLLSNLETDKHKLIQVILSGQPELIEMLADRRLRQLQQRIAVHCHLKPLTVRETAEYISRRLYVAGNKGQVHFSPAAARRIHKTSGGIPRLINKICDFSLTAAYVKDAPSIDPGHVKRALAELADLDCCPNRKSGRTWRVRLGATAMLLIVLVVALYFTRQPSAFSPPPTIQTALAAIEKGVASTPAPASLTADTGGPACVPVVCQTPHSAITDTTVTEIANTAALPDLDEKKPARAQPALPAPYALQLGSYRTLEHTRRGVAQYQHKEVPAHFQVVENGQWYRIVAGKFETQAQAARYKNDHGLKQARIIHAPWTVKVLPRQKDLSDAEILRFISEIGYDGLMQTGLSGENAIYTGLFGSVEDAAITAERINSSHRLLARVVER